MPATTTPDSTATGASNMPTASPRITCRRTARSSTPSNGYGNSHADCAYTTATSRPSTKSSALSRVNLQTGVGATPPCADYAQSFKTLCIYDRVDSGTMAIFTTSIAYETLDSNEKSAQCSPPFSKETGSTASP